MSCWAAVCVEEDGRDREGGGGGGVRSPVSGEDNRWRDRAAVWLDVVASMPSWMI